MIDQQVLKRYGVTDEQLNSVAFFTDEQTHTPLFKVASATNIETVYTVKWNVRYNRPQCQCKAACDGCVCWHVRACMAVLSIHAQTKREEAEARHRLAEEEAAALAEREYLDSITPYQPSEKEVQRDLRRYAPRPFSLMH